ncbi:MAG TPA: SRPBCC family protein, partial [Anaerolineales bacterium]|nr:SRPBCC family protein [Anaerolineales bacterium]
QAYTQPELIKRWWNAKRGEVTVAEVDLRIGGAWRYVMVTPDGIDVGFHGEFREIVPNQRIVSTEIFEGMPGMEVPPEQGDDSAAVNTVTLTERAGRTTATMLSEYPSQEIRDMVIQSGMEAGMQDAYDLLEEVAVSLA